MDQDILNLLNKFPKIRFFGNLSDYEPETTHKNVIYFATDTRQILFNSDNFGGNGTVYIEDYEFLSQSSSSHRDEKYRNLQEGDILLIRHKTNENRYVGEFRVITHEPYPLLVGSIQEEGNSWSTPYFAYVYDNFSAGYRVYLNFVKFDWELMNILAYDKIQGKWLSKNDFTDDYKEKVDSIDSLSESLDDLKDQVDSLEIPTKVSQLTNDSKYQTESQVNARISEIIGAAPEALDTLGEIADKLGDTDDAVSAIVGVVNDHVADAEEKYFPKTGGTIDGDTKVQDSTFSAFGVKNTNEDSNSAISFENGDGLLGYIGFDSEQNLALFKPTRLGAPVKRKVFHESHMGSGSGLDADSVHGHKPGVNNDNLVYYVDFPPLSVLIDLGYLPDNHSTNNTVGFLQAICKWAIDTYVNQGRVILQGYVIPNSGGYCVISLYSNNGKDPSTNLPRYCEGTYYELDGNIKRFGTSDYTWHYYIMASTNSNVASSDKLKLKQLTNEDLDTIKDVERYNVYFANGLNDVTNKPVNNDSAFYLQVISITTYYTIQIFITPAGTIYRRPCVNNVWSDWKRILTEDNVSAGINTKELTSEDLNDIKKTNFMAFYGAPGNSVTNKPEGVDSFGLQVYGISGVRICQVLTDGYGKVFKRSFDGNSTWTGWKQVATTEDTVANATKLNNLDVNSLPYLPVKTFTNQSNSNNAFLKIVPKNVPFTDSFFICDITGGSSNYLSVHFDLNIAIDSIKFSNVSKVTPSSSYENIFYTEIPYSNGLIDRVYIPIPPGARLKIITDSKSTLSIVSSMDTSLEPQIRSVPSKLTADNTLNYYIGNKDLDTLKDSNNTFYYAYSDNTCANKPTGVTDFNLICNRLGSSSKSKYVQVLISGTGAVYKRYYNGTSWSSWVRMLDETNGMITKVYNPDTPISANDVPYNSISLDYFNAISNLPTYSPPSGSEGVYNESTRTGILVDFGFSSGGIFRVQLYFDVGLYSAVNPNVQYIRYYVPGSGWGIWRKIHSY